MSKERISIADLPIVQEAVNAQIDTFLCSIRDQVQKILMDSLLCTLGVEARSSSGCQWSWRSNDGLVRDILLRETSEAVRQSLAEQVSKVVAKIAEDNVTKVVESETKTRYKELYRRSLMEYIERKAREDASADMETAFLEALWSSSLPAEAAE